MRLRPLLLACPLLLTVACGATVIERRVPIGETFPTVSGESLEGEVVELPTDLDGEPAILLVGYVQDTQFDLDRWLIGLLQLETPARLLEVPTIDGMIPGMFGGFIDDGMRSGIPPQDWAAVVTLYGDDAAKVVELTGNEGPRNGRILLLDREGKIVWFTDRGWSASLVIELDQRARELAGR